MVIGLMHCQMALLVPSDNVCEVCVLFHLLTHLVRKVCIIVKTEIVFS